MRSRMMQIGANIVAVIVTLSVNGLANALPFNGLQTGEISDRFKVYFVPAGYVFAIWGVIYMGLIAFAIYQALPAQRSNTRLARIGWLFALSCACNVIWLFLWHWLQFPATLIFMLGLLACLLGIYLRLDIGRARPAPAERWCVDIPFSIYLGWITVATVANVTDVLDYAGYDGAPLRPEWWAALLALVSAGLAAAMAYTRRDAAYGLVIVWALVGIAIKQAGAPVVPAVAWVAAGIAALSALGALFVRRQPGAASATRATTR